MWGDRSPTHTLPLQKRNDAGGGDTWGFSSIDLEAGACTCPAGNVTRRLRSKTTSASLPKPLSRSRRRTPTTSPTFDLCSRQRAEVMATVETLGVVGGVCPWTPSRPTDRAARTATRAASARTNSGSRDFSVVGLPTTVHPAVIADCPIRAELRATVGAARRVEVLQVMVPPPGHGHVSPPVHTPQRCGPPPAEERAVLANRRRGFFASARRRRRRSTRERGRSL